MVELKKKILSESMAVNANSVSQCSLDTGGNDVCNITSSSSSSSYSSVLI